MTGTDDELVDALRARVGDALRVVGRHDGDSWTVAFVREDVRDSYGRNALDDIAGDLVLGGMESAQQESLYDLGSLHATVRLFDDGIVAHVPADDRSGHVVSFEGVDGVVGRDVVEVVRRTVE